MAKTLLNGVNEVLKRASIVDKNSELGSLTHSGKQVFIDLAIQAWNEIIDDLYSNAGLLKPNQAGESSITLSATRSYNLASDLVELRWPLRDKENGQYINEYKGGLEGMRTAQPFENEEGTPELGVIDPQDGTLFLNRTPVTDLIGNVYYYLYWKDLVLSSASDTMPFNDVTFRAMVPAVEQYWSLYQKKDYEEGIYRASIGRASRLLRRVPARESYVERYGGYNNTDPLCQDV